MVVDIILLVLFALQTIISLTLMILRNRENDKEIEKSDDLFEHIWRAWYQNQFKNDKEIEK